MTSDKIWPKQKQKNDEQKKRRSNEWTNKRIIDKRKNHIDVSPHPKKKIAEPLQKFGKWKKQQKKNRYKKKYRKKKQQPKNKKISNKKSEETN